VRSPNLNRYFNEDRGALVIRGIEADSQKTRKTRINVFRFLHCPPRPSPCSCGELHINCGAMKSDKDNVQLSAVEDHDGILTIRGGGPRRDWNGIHYKQGMSAKNVGTTKLSANIATIPPGGIAAAHIHVGFELILYIVEGKVRHEFGPGLKQVLENEAGDFIYIKPGVPHEVFNMSETEPVVAFVARSSANEWDDIIPYDRTECR
jgi:uncharacterized RmlC-like cupin family protein